METETAGWTVEDTFGPEFPPPVSPCETAAAPPAYHLVQATPRHRHERAAAGDPTHEETAMRCLGMIRNWRPMAAWWTLVCLAAACGGGKDGGSTGPWRRRGRCRGRLPARGATAAGHGARPVQILNGGMRPEPGRHLRDAVQLDEHAGRGQVHRRPRALSHRWRHQFEFSRPTPGATSSRARWTKACCGSTTSSDVLAVQELESVERSERSGAPSHAGSAFAYLVAKGAAESATSVEAYT